MVKIKLESLATLVLLVAGTGLSRPVAAQVTQDKSGGYLFRVKYVKGMTLTYEMRVKASISGLNAQQSQVFNGNNHFDETETTVSEVLEVKNGIATIRNTRKATIKGSGKNKDNRDYVTTKKVDARGRTIGSHSQGTFELVDLPDRPLKIGESFNSSAYDLFNSGSSKATPSDCKFLGIKTVGSRKVAQFNLSLTFNANHADMNGSGSGYLLIDMADGQLYSLRYTIKGKADLSKEKSKSGIAGPSNVGLNSEMTMTRKY